MSIQWTLYDSYLPSYTLCNNEEFHWFKKLPQSKTDIFQKEQDITQLLDLSQLKHSLQILPSWLHLVSSAHHWCLAPIDIANLWNTFNRIRIIMEEFGCAQIRTSSSCSCERKWGYRGALAGFFWLKYSPTIADWSLKFIWKRHHRKKIAITKTEANLDQNR